MASSTNSDGSSTECVLLSSTPGEEKIVDTTEEDCNRDFTCKSMTNGGYYNVTCPGKMTVYHYEQEVTNNWSCTAYFDGCSYTYSYTEKVTNTWTKNFPCGMPGGTACCADGDMLIGEGHDAQPGPPDPLPPNPFR